MNGTGKTNDSGQGKEPFVERKRTLKAASKESASIKRERTMSKEQLEALAKRVVGKTLDLRKNRPGRIRRRRNHVANLENIRRLHPLVRKEVLKYRGSKDDAISEQWDALSAEYDHLVLRMQVASLRTRKHISIKMNKIWSAMLKVPAKNSLHSNKYFERHMSELRALTPGQP